MALLAAEYLLVMPFQKIPIGPPVSTTRVMDSLAMQIAPQKEPVVDPVLPTPAVWDDVCGFKRRYRVLFGHRTYQALSEQTFEVFLNDAGDLRWRGYDDGKEIIYGKEPELHALGYKQKVELSGI